MLKAHGIQSVNLQGRLSVQKKSELLLTAVIFARSTSLIFSRISLGSFSPFNLMALRFILAFMLMFPLFIRKLTKITIKELIYGMILGALFTGIITMELLGLRLTDSGTTSFIENSAMVFVPLIQLMIFRIVPKKLDIIRLVIAASGIAALTLGGGSLFRPGSLYLITAAVIYAVFIILTARFSRKGEAINIGVVQIGTAGVLSLILSVIFESPRLPKTTPEWGMILALAAVCTGFGLTLQPLAQKGTSPERAGMLCAVSPMSAAVLGIIFLGEQLTANKIAGFALIALSLFAEPIISHLKKSATGHPGKSAPGTTENDS